MRGQTPCPFCGAEAPSPSLASARNLAGAALAAFVLSACYGTSVTDKTTPTWLDKVDDTAHTGDTAETTP
ncbi:MAG: hypothetical protein H6738_21915 [Alphaproteobacteria bacterium]|nr:hypothetical protein [Alphaproteobacteria bacterium]MCB9699455.1 hypothetical protein [Alphaproteobacteria bacterium]